MADCRCWESFSRWSRPTAPSHPIRTGCSACRRGGEEQLRQQAQLLYRQIAREELTRRVAFYAPKLGVQPMGLRINGAKGRWGSCSGRNSLNFSWRLMLAPEHCVNYVVVHELCHILHHDHSAAFWREVERFFPDWKECRRQLAEVAGAAYFFEE